MPFDSVPGHQQHSTSVPAGIRRNVDAACHFEESAVSLNRRRQNQSPYMCS
jgi:hypothetical protein